MSDSENRRTVAVIGAGAIGLSLASAFARAGDAVTVCGRGSGFDRVSITEDDVAESWPITHTTDPESIRDIDTVVVAVKAHHTSSVSAWLDVVARPTTSVLVAQNGLEVRERFSPLLGRARIVPSVVYLNAERTAPGAATIRRVAHADLAVGDDPTALAFAYTLRIGGMRVAVETDLVSATWSKLLSNLTANPLTALTGRRAEVLREPDVADIARRIMAEALVVARAEGARLADDEADRVMSWLQAVPAGSTTSMRQDRLAGRPLEHDAITGAVLRAAERHGIDAPVTRIVHTLVAAIEPGGGAA